MRLLKRFPTRGELTEGELVQVIHRNNLYNCQLSNGHVWYSKPYSRRLIGQTDASTARRVASIVSSTGGGGGGVPSDFYTNSVQTTDATVTTIQTIPTVSGDAIQVIADVIGLKSDNSAHAGFRAIAVYRNSSGSLSLQGAVNYLFKQRQGGWNITLVRSSADILLRVTGQAATTINWRSSVKVVRKI